MLFNGKILHAGYAVAEQVTGNIDEFADAGIHSWQGEFLAAPNDVIVAGETYNLELNDGRSGEIMILKMLHNSSAVSAYRFSGFGALVQSSAGQLR